MPKVFEVTIKTIPLRPLTIKNMSNQKLKNNIRETTMRVVVYCSSAESLPESWREGASAVGRWIGEHGATLVYGGVNAGLMTETASAARAAGARIVGIVPARRCNMVSPLNDIQISVADLNERKATMELLGDVFVVLPGGYGTLDELASTFAYINFTNQIGKHIVIYNPDGIFDPLMTQLDIMAEAGLMKPASSDVIIATSTPAQTTAQLDRLLYIHNNHD